MEDKEILKYMITFLICIVLSIVIIVGSSDNKKLFMWELMKLMK